MPRKKEICASRPRPNPSETKTRSTSSEEATSIFMLTLKHIPAHSQYRVYNRHARTHTLYLFGVRYSLCYSIYKYTYNKQIGKLCVCLQNNTNKQQYACTVCAQNRGGGEPSSRAAPTRARARPGAAEPRKQTHIYLQ